MPKIFIQLSII